jgi:hypothetical protein
MRRWHWGKLAILWAWGVLIAGPLFTYSLPSARGIPPTSQQVVAALLSVLIVAILSAVTWRWLGGKET